MQVIRTYMHAYVHRTPVILVAPALYCKIFDFECNCKKSLQYGAPPVCSNFSLFPPSHSLPTQHGLPESSGRMFVGRLRATTHKEDLSEHFEKYGTLRDVHIPQPSRVCVWGVNVCVYGRVNVWVWDGEVWVVCVIMHGVTSCQCTRVCVYACVYVYLCVCPQCRMPVYPSGQPFK